MSEIKFREKQPLKFIPEAGVLVPMTIPAPKLIAGNIWWLNDDEKIIVNVMSECIENKRGSMKYEYDRGNIESGFLGGDTKRFDFKKWEELFLEDGVLEGVSKITRVKQKEILTLVLNKLDPERPYRDMMQQLLKIKSTPDKRGNDLHYILKEVLKAKGTEASAKDIWKELRNNKDTYDAERVIQEIADDGIYWISKAGVEQKLSVDSFDKTISKLRRKII